MPFSWVTEMIPLLTHFSIVPIFNPAIPPTPAFHSWHRQIYIQAGRTPTDDSGKFVLTGNAAKFRKDHGSIATHMSGDRAGNRTFLNLSLIILCNDTLYILAVIVKISYNSQIFNGSVILGDKRFFQSVNSV